MFMHLDDLQMSDTNPLNDLFAKGFDVYQRSALGFCSASFKQELNKLRALLSVLESSRQTILTGQISLSGTSLILFPDGASSDRIPPWKFFCYVSWQRVKYWRLFSSL